MAGVNDETQNTPAGQILRPMMSAPKGATRRPRAPRPSDAAPESFEEPEPQNSPAGAILRPMLPLAKRRRDDLAKIKKLDAERASRRASGQRQRRRD